jgi:hypothetical protein
VGEFFDRPDPVRVLLARDDAERAPERVELDESGRWRETLTALGAAGRVVVAVEDRTVVVR